MSDKNVTMAKAIQCPREGPYGGKQVNRCAELATDYINQVVPQKMDSYTCTATSILSVQNSFSNWAASTTNSILVLCSGTLKNSQAVAEPSAPHASTEKKAKAK